MSDTMTSDRTILDRRWSRVSVSRTIAAPQAATWAAIADHERWLTWHRPLKEFRLLEGAELAVGSVVWEHELQPDSSNQSLTTVTIVGGFAFGLLGWVLVSYTYPQMLAAMYFEYRSALKGLAATVETTN